MEISVLHTLATKEHFTKYSKFIKKHLVTKEVYTIFVDLREYYKSHEEVDWKLFSGWFKLVRHASMRPETMELYDVMFDNLIGYTPTTADMEVVHTLIAREYAARLAEFTGDIADGVAGDLSQVTEIMGEYNIEVDRCSSIDDKLVSKDFDALLESVSRKEGLDWRLKELNLMLGPLVPGDSIILAARPNSGKTTLLCSEVSHFINQIPDDHKIMWFCNEEKGDGVGARILQAYFGKTDADLIKYAKDYKSVWPLKANKIDLYFDRGMHMNDVVEKLYAEKDKVSLVIIDQLHNMHGFDRVESEHERLAKLFKWARELATDFPLISVHQLKGEAGGLLFPPMEMLYGNTTMVQGACDVVLTLGRSYSSGVHENTRGLSAPKNKMPGEFGLEGKYCNTRFEVEIQPNIARFTGAMK